MQPHKKYLNGREKRESERKRKMPDNSPLLLILYLIGITGIIITLNSLIMMEKVLVIQIAEVIKLDGLV